MTDYTITMPLTSLDRDRQRISASPMAVTPGGYRVFLDNTKYGEFKPVMEGHMWLIMDTMRTDNGLVLRLC